MELKINFDRFENLLNKMGADFVKWESSASHRKFKDVLQTKGFEIESLEEIKFVGGAIFYKGEQVVIYIKDNKCYDKNSKYESIEDYINSPDDLRKFHFSDCTKIKEMKDTGRFERYIATTRKDGFFLIDAEYEEEVIYDAKVKLLPCRICLKECEFYNFANLSKFEKNEFVYSLNVKDILKDYGSKIPKKPRHNENTVPKNNYTKNWKETSRDVRDDNNWICQKCKVDLSKKQHKKLLHVHHKNGNKWDNKYFNLQALCILCHHEEHGHMHVSEEDKGTIEILRIMQKV